jgi:pimeloyl-ACP methyl ester carboxylesterase
VVTIHHEATGSGPVVLFTHGFASSSHRWAATVADLAADHTTVVWDMLGHGRSDSPDDPAAYSVPTSLEAMLAIVDATGGGPATVVGHSLGGYLSLELAIAHPDRVAALVLVDTGPGYRSDRGREQWNEMAEGYARELDERGLDGLPGGDELTAAVHRDAAGLARSARGVLRQSDGHVMEALPTIAAPTLVVVGEHDTPFRAGSEYMAAKILRASLTVIDGAGHAPPLSHPAAFVAALRSFLTGS